MWDCIPLEKVAIKHNIILMCQRIPYFCDVGFHNVGTITISGGEVTFDSNQLTLTCIFTGGPATTVTWTRDSITVTEGTETVLDDPVTAQYTHTLTVTTGGEYTCTVSNNKPSSDSATVFLG